MPNQWSAVASNSQNQYDRVGFIYSNLVGTKLWCCIDKLYPDSGFTMDDFWNNFPYEAVEAIKPDYVNLFRNAVEEFNNRPISSEAKNKILELIELLDNSTSIEDYNTIKTSIVDWEAEVISNSSNYQNDEVLRLLSAASVVRYGTLIAMQSNDLPTSSEQLRAAGKGIFGKIIAGIVGAAIAIFLLAPILTAGPLAIGGYLVYGALGAWGGVALFDDIFGE